MIKGNYVNECIHVCMHVLVALGDEMIIDKHNKITQNPNS
jgi:hypothetical protein